jgi:hypothetical protein
MIRAVSRRLEGTQRWIRAAFSLLAVFAASAAMPGCGSTATDSVSAKPEPAMEKTLNDVPKSAWTITYRDGSANQFVFSGNPGADAKFEYDPVKLEEGGTGQYSGGNPNSGALTPALCEELWRRVLELESNKGVHEEDRNKGTGAFFIDDGSRKRDFIVQMGPVLDEFNGFVGQFRAK